MVVAGLQFGNAFYIDVKADHGALFAKLNSQRQTDVAQANDGNVAPGCKLAVGFYCSHTGN